MPQGTVKTYNQRTKSGIIIDDARNELLFDWESFRDSGMREFRIGQRVKFALTGTGPSQKVRQLTIVSF